MPPAKKDRDWVTIRLCEPDRNLLRDLAKLPTAEPAKTRHDALLKLTKIVEELNLPAVQAGRASIRLGIPKELKAALEARSRETGLAQQFILVLAARAFRDAGSPSPHAKES